MGCLPAVITMNSQFNALFQRRCVGMYCSVAQQYNQMLQNAVKSMHLASAHLGAKIYSLDIYTALADIIQGPGRHGKYYIYIYILFLSSFFVVFFFFSYAFFLL